MYVKIPEDLLYEMVELLVEAKALKPAKDECVLHLSKRNRVLDQLLVMRRNTLAQKPGQEPLNENFPTKNNSQSTPAA